MADLETSGGLGSLISGIWQDWLILRKAKVSIFALSVFPYKSRNWQTFSVESVNILDYGLGGVAAA